jgi:hypothetical protein
MERKTDGELERWRDGEGEGEREQGERQTYRVWMCPCARAVRSVRPWLCLVCPTSRASVGLSVCLPVSLCQPFLSLLLSPAIPPPAPASAPRGVCVSLKTRVAPALPRA